MKKRWFFWRVHAFTRRFALFKRNLSRERERENKREREKRERERKRERRESVFSEEEVIDFLA